VPFPAGLLALSLRSIVAQLAHVAVQYGDPYVDAIVSAARPEILRDLDAETRAVLLQDFTDLLRD
jgi:hypothetical protein